MTLADAIRMAYYVQQINLDSIKRGVINEPDQVTSSFSASGEYILLPDMKAVDALRDQVFDTAVAQAPAAPAPQAPAPQAGNDKQAVVSPQQEEPTAEPQPAASPTPAPTPTIELPPQDAAKAEKAQVIVLNGTSIPGLAARTHEFLMLKGMRVIQEGNADNLVDYTELRVSANKPATVAYIASLLNVPASRIFNQNADPNMPADIVVIIGTDWAQKNTMP